MNTVTVFCDWCGREMEEQPPVSSVPIYCSLRCEAQAREAEQPE